MYIISAPKLTLCKEEDSDCLTKSANVIFQLTIKGSQELNIEVLDPMYQEEVLGDLIGLRFKLTNSTIKGSKNCDVVNMKYVLNMYYYHLARWGNVNLSGDWKKVQGSEIDRRRSCQRGYFLEELDEAGHKLREAHNLQWLKSGCG